MPFKLMLIPILFQLNGCFIFDGGKSLEKRMVRFSIYIIILTISHLLYRLSKKQWKLVQIVVNIRVIGYFIPVKKNLGRHLLMVWFLSHSSWLTWVCNISIFYFNFVEVLSPLDMLIGLRVVTNPDFWIQIHRVVCSKCLVFTAVHCSTVVHLALVFWLFSPYMPYR